MHPLVSGPNVCLPAILHQMWSCLACFLGMSCGCMAAHQSRDWLSYFPILALATVCRGAGPIHSLRVVERVRHRCRTPEIPRRKSSSEPNTGGAGYRAEFTITHRPWIARRFLCPCGADVSSAWGQVLGRGVLMPIRNRILGLHVEYYRQPSSAIAGFLVDLAAFSYRRRCGFLISVAGNRLFCFAKADSLTLPRSVALVALLLAVTVPSITRARNGSESYLVALLRG